MTIIIFAIFFTLAIIIRSYTHIDNNDVTDKDLIKAFIPALIGLISLTLRATYFALPEEAMVSAEYLNYRNILMVIFLVMMGYIIRAGIYGCVFLYRRRS